MFLLNKTNKIQLSLISNTFQDDLFMSNGFKENLMTYFLFNGIQ